MAAMAGISRGVYLNQLTEVLWDGGGINDAIDMVKHASMVKILGGGRGVSNVNMRNIIIRDTDTVKSACTAKLFCVTGRVYIKKLIGSLGDWHRRFPGRGCRLDSGWDGGCERCGTGCRCKKRQ